ncbi:MAG: transposase [Clostridiales bacterium]|nr:transposase [Clostridiales bacterium]
MTRRVHSRSKIWRKVFHGTVMGRKAYLRLRPRRFYCGACQRTFRERFPGLEKWSRQTIQGEQEILSHLEGSSIHQAGKRSGVGDWVVRRVLKRRVKGEIPIEEALLGLSEIVLGIDEHSFRGQRMMITVTCLAPERRLLAILPDDRLVTLRDDLRRIPEEVKERIVGVCIDMKKAWRLEVNRQLPHVQVVADRFHVIRMPTGGWMKRGCWNSS